MTKHTRYTNSNLTDQLLKEQGNKLFASHKYDDAIYCYTKAIIKNPNNPTYFTNRALCYLKLKRWELSCQDCRRALEIEPHLFKAHYFLGQCLMELELYDEAIKHIEKAYDLSKEQKQNFSNDITAQLRLARKKRFDLREKQRVCQEIELQNYLNRLIKKDMNNRLSKLLLDEPNEKQLLEKQQEIEEEDRLKELANLFAKADERRRKREVPDYLCGKISFDILIDPVITPSGITYERKDIEEHLQRIGNFDPLTRVTLTKDQLIPNFSMKEVVDAFIAENEWAVDF